jgi:molybdopterin-guanine dinucleotide biosynthesis protein A
LNINCEKNSCVTGIVLAGGRSSRLGRQKALEKIGEKGLIENTVDILVSFSQEVLVVTSKEQLASIASVNLKARLVVDIYPGKAALGGIYTGLANANTQYGLVVACDMPFLNSALLRYIVEMAPGYDVVLPRVNGKVELLHAVYSKDCLDKVKKMLDENTLQILKLLDMVNIRYVEDKEIGKFDPDHLSFFNINTLDDLTVAENLMANKRASINKGKDK